MDLRQIPNTLKTLSVRSFSKHFIAISALSLASGHSFAQKGFDFGIKGELQSSSLINGPDFAAGNELNFKNRMGGAGGVGVGYSFTKHIGAELDILTAAGGTEYTGKTSLIDGNKPWVMCNQIATVAALNNINMGTYYAAKIYLSYIKIPILFRYNTNNSKRVYFSLFLGPQFDFLSSVDYKINDIKVSKFGGSLTSKDLYAKSGTDGVLGLGLGVNVAKNFFVSAHLKLEFGFGDAENKSAEVSSGTKFYSTKRGAVNNAAGGGLITIGYKLVKKDKDEKKKKKMMEDTDETQTKTKTKTKTSSSPSTPGAKSK